MATAEVEEAPVAPAMPDYMTDPNAVLQDVDAAWRYGVPPDYSKTRTYYEQTKQSTHEPGSLFSLVENLVKNWEVEASFKTRLSDWRTIDPENYSFSINGGPHQTGQDMLKNGTYNAIIQPGNEYYCPRFSDFSSSHKTFKRMMPTFAWEVLDVVGAPPRVAVKWRHWGVMKNDYVGFNNKGEEVTAKAHGRTIDIQGTTWATVNDKLQVTNLETWFDPIELFRQIAANGIVNKVTASMNEGKASNPTSIPADHITTKPEISHDSETGSPTSDSSYVKVSADTNKRPADEDVNKLHDACKATQEVTSASNVTHGNEQQGDVSAVVMSGDQVDPTAGLGTNEASDSVLEHRSHSITAPTMPEPMESSSPPGAYPTAAEDQAAASKTHDNAQADGQPMGEVFTEGKMPSHGPEVTVSEPNNAVAVPGDSTEAKRAHEELSTTTRAECPFMNKE